jgi:hypothetical protein
MSKGIESRTFLWSSASFKIIKIGILLPLVRRFEMNKTQSLQEVHYNLKMHTMMTTYPLDPLLAHQ